MANRQDDTPGKILVSPSQLISAAGGYDALAGELKEGVIDVLDVDFTTGDDQLDGSLFRFADRWKVGLQALVQAQLDRGRALHYFADEFLGYDVDAAYAFLVKACGMDLR